MVPNGWTQKFLEDIAEFSQGIQVNPDKQFTEYSEGMVRFLRITDFVDQDETPRFIQNPSNRFIVNNTDLSMVRYGSAGAGDLVRGLSGAIANNLFRVIPNELEVTKDYLWVYLSQSKIKHFLFGNSTSSTMPAVSFKLVGKVLVDLPPLPEQQKIAKILSTWDKAIGTTERLIENSSQQKKALMQQLLTGKKRLLDESGQRFAGEWEEKTLIDAGMTVTDGDRGKEYPNSSEFYDEGDYLFLSAKNVTKKGFLFEDTQFISKEKYEKLGKGIVNRGDVVLTTRGTVGQTAYYDDSVQYEFLRVNSGMVTLGCNNSELESNFFYALTNSSLFTRQVESLTFGSAQPQLTIRIIKSLKVPIPPVPEQQKIATVLTNADKEIELLEQQLADLQQEKKALMQVLLTGKKRVVVDGEVA